MSTEKKVLLGVVVGVTVLLILLFSSEKVERELAPRPRAAWVAVEIGQDRLARTGRVEIASGTPFRLHAVLAAETWGGDLVYYSEAERLEIEGEEVEPKALRRWTRESQPRILWFTVEGFRPYLEVEDPVDLEQFRFEEIFRADWPRGWSIPGDLRPGAERDLIPASAARIPSFGTQRYHVRIEIFGPQSQITPRLRLQSLRASDLPAEAEEFTTVVSSLPGIMSAPSRVFGLTQIEADSDMLSPVAERIAGWTRTEIAFSRLTVLRDLLDRAGVTYDRLGWKSIDLLEGPEWSDEGAKGGDLLRVGDRWVVLFRDQGRAGILDRDDLCLDFDRGARVRGVGEVFTGEGLVDWARLDSAGDPAPRP